MPYQKFGTRPCGQGWRDRGATYLAVVVGRPLLVVTLVVFLTGTGRGGWKEQGKEVVGEGVNGRQDLIRSINNNVIWVRKEQ